jgi:hypothetical protein
VVRHDGGLDDQKALAGDWAVTSATDDGLAGDRTTAGSYTTQTVIILPKGIVRLDTVKWDTTAGTYTLTIDGVSHGTQTRADTGTLTWNTGGQIIHHATIFNLVRSTAAATVRDASAGAPYEGELIILPPSYYYDTTTFSFRPAIRVTGARAKLTDFVGL